MQCIVGDGSQYILPYMLYILAFVVDYLVFFLFLTNESKCECRRAKEEIKEL